MRALWRKYGKPGGARVGYVDNPYSNDDVRTTLGEVTGNQALADDFFRRYITGHDLMDYDALFARAGLIWRRINPGRASLGLLRVQDGVNGGVRLAAGTPVGSPAYVAGLDRDDEIVQIGDIAIRDTAGYLRAQASAKPGQRLPITFVRNGARQTTTVTLEEDSRRELVPAENAGATLTDAQRRFRQVWLSSPVRNGF